MPDTLTQILAQILTLPGLGWVVAITFVSGVVYGFAGFGAALVFMPVATIYLPVRMAVAAFAISAFASLVTVVPRALPQADRRAIAPMILLAAASLPVGLWILRSHDVTTMRWAVLAVTAITLAALISGWRYAMTPGPRTRAGVALATGLVGGATGLVGPIMILFQLGGQDSVARSRANTVIFLTLTGVLTVPWMAVQGMLGLPAMVLGLLLMLPYGVAARLGQALFDPARQRLYRSVAYLVIAASILMGLPIYS